MSYEQPLIVGYSLLVIYLFYLSYDLMGKPQNKVEHFVLKWLQPQNIAIFVRLLAMWSISGGTALLALIAQSTPYTAFFDAIFIISLYLNLAITLIYLALYFTFQVSTRLEEAGNWRYK